MKQADLSCMFFILLVLPLVFRRYASREARKTSDIPWCEHRSRLLCRDQERLLALVLTFSEVALLRWQSSSLLSLVCSILWPLSLPALNSLTSISLSICGHAMRILHTPLTPRRADNFVSHYTAMADRVPLLDLFSGIGGFSFALRECARTVAYCQWHPPKPQTHLHSLLNFVTEYRMNFTDLADAIDAD